jgi:hypothetical protein
MRDSGQRRVGRDGETVKEKKVKYKRKRPHGKCRSVDLCAFEDAGLCTSDKPCGHREVTGLSAQLDMALAPKRTGSVQHPAPAVKYSDELFDRMCDLIASGISVNKLCQMEGMPSAVTLRRWLTTDERRIKYARSLEARAETAVDELLDKADECIALVNGESEDSKRAGAIVQAYRGRADDVKWCASKLLPKRYGDAKSVGGTGQGNTYNVMLVSSDNLAMGSIVKAAERVIDLGVVDATGSD